MKEYVTKTDIIYMKTQSEWPRMEKYEQTRQGTAV
jgi:hypothetical protein